MEDAPAPGTCGGLSPTPIPATLAAAPLPWTTPLPERGPLPVAAAPRRRRLGACVPEGTEAGEPLAAPGRVSALAAPLSLAAAEAQLPPPSPSSSVPRG